MTALRSAVLDAHVVDVGAAGRDQPPSLAFRFRHARLGEQVEDRFAVPFERRSGHLAGGHLGEDILDVRGRQALERAAEERLRSPLRIGERLLPCTMRVIFAGQGALRLARSGCSTIACAQLRDLLLVSQVKYLR